MPSKAARLAALCALSLAPAATLLVLVGDQAVRRSLLVSLGLSAVACVGTVRMIPAVVRMTLRRGMFGYDLNKRGTPAGEEKVPEALGLVPGIAFLLVSSAFQWVQGMREGWESLDGLLPEYNAALATVCFMVFLGFVDDVLDLPWRVKLTLPAIATLPLLVAYDGGTTIVVPLPLRPVIGAEFLQLGILYYVYMWLLSIFCTNSINILAGINGLEAGQTFVIAAAVLTLNLSRLVGSPPQEVRDANLFSAYLMLPLLGTTLGLLTFNWYPSKVFVGDTFTYFAGVVLAVAGILGHFSETLLLFFLPQVFNFVYSLPQLFHIVPCPRHRLPKFDPDTGKLTPTPNWNLVNFALQCAGRLTEEQLCVMLLLLQGLCCFAVFAVRFALAGTYKA